MSDRAFSKAKLGGPKEQTTCEIRQSRQRVACRQRIRVMHVIPTLNCGGAERVCMEIARDLDPSCFEVTVLLLETLQGTRLEHELQERDVRIESLQKRQGPDPRMFWRIYRAFQRHRPDILHTHLNVLQYVLPALALRRIPCLHTMHNIAEKEAIGLVRFFNSLSFRFGTIPVGISPLVRESVRRLYRVRKVPLIPNGIDLRPFRNTHGIRGAWRSRNGFSEEDFLIVSVGRLYPQKNFPLLLSTFAEFAPRHSNLKLIIAGEGQFRKDLERRIDELRIADRVYLAGERSDIPNLLLASDLYITTSLWEGNPLSVIEAMAAGLPVIASAVGGIPDLIEEGIDGLLVPPDDRQELLHAMSDMMDSPEQRRRLSTAARMKAFRTMGTTEMVRAYEALYEEFYIASSDCREHRNAEQL